MDGFWSGGCPNHGLSCDCLLDSLDVLLSDSLQHIPFIEYDLLPRVLENIEAVSFHYLINELFNQCERNDRCLNFIACILRRIDVPAHRFFVITLIMLVTFPSS